MYPVSGSNYIVENRNLSQGEADHANILLFGSERLESTTSALSCVCHVW